MSIKVMIIYCFILCLIFNNSEPKPNPNIFDYLLSIFFFTLLYLVINYADIGEVRK